MRSFHSSFPVSDETLQAQTPPPPEDQPLQLVEELRRAWGVLRLQPQRMLQVAKGSRDALEVAIVFLFIGAILSYIGGLMSPLTINGVAWPVPIKLRIVAAIVQVGLMLGIIGVLTGMARFFRAPVTFEQLFRVLGYGAIIFVVTIFPSLLLLAFGWWFAVAFVALRSLGQLESDRALVAVLVAVLVLFLVARTAVMGGLYLWSGHWTPISYL